MGEVKEKKRKRSDDTSRPSKKSAAHGSQQQKQQQFTGSIKVTSVRTVTESPPVIATTPGLCLPSSIRFQTYTKAPPSTTKPSKMQPPNMMLHSSTHEKLDYTGREEGSGGRESHLKHYIGVFDPKTGQLSVMEARKMAIRGVVRSQQPAQDAEDERDPSKVFPALANFFTDDS